MKQENLDFVQGIINRCYLCAQEDSGKSSYYNQGILFAAFREMDEMLKILRKKENFERRTISSNK